MMIILMLELLIPIFAGSKSDSELLFNELANNLDKVILKFFGSIDDLHQYGLTKHYNLLKQDVIKNNLIGLFLYGADKSKDDKLYQIYTTNQGSKINLTRNSICYKLIKEYILEENLEELCRKTPNFDKYYKA